MGTEVYYTFKLTEEVKVAVGWTVTGECPDFPELQEEARDRLERAGLPRDLEQLDY